ncbi:hypothetical protein Q3A68_15525 [Mucilaginibacter sp. BT774]|nr:hypothetical protein [Mucilaginibacter sp. BT774]
MGKDKLALRKLNNRKPEIWAEGPRTRGPFSQCGEPAERRRGG